MDQTILAQGDTVIGYSRRWAHILPSVFIVYTISYLDRVNIATALPAISQDLRLSPTQAGFISGIFFWGYLVTFLIGGWLSNRFGARRTTLCSLIAWGLFAMASGFAYDFYSLAIMRVLLGAAEGPIWSSMSAILAQWFIKSERGRVFSAWNISLPVGAILSGPISGLLLSHYSWHVMMVVEGVPAWLWAVIWWRTIPRSLESAAWLPPAERLALEGGLAAEQANFDATIGSVSVRDVLLHPGVWLLLVAKTFNNMVAYGFTLWLPTAIKEASKFGIGSVGLLSALPYVAAGIGAYWIGRSSDLRRERRLHGAIPLMLQGVLLFTIAHVQAQSFWVMMGLFILTGLVLFMTLPLITVIYTDLLPRRQAIIAIAFSGAVANLFGGFFGPMLVGWLRSLTGNFSLAFTVLAGVGLVGGFLLLAVDDAGAKGFAVQPARRRAEIGN